MPTTNQPANLPTIQTNPSLHNPLSELRLRFDYADLEAAANAWGCNCGPAALAAICGLSLKQVAPACAAVQFRERRYMNSSMMAQALRGLGRSFTENRLNLDRRTECDQDSLPTAGLARIQFSGPWIIKGKPARWAAQHTHWAASWKYEGRCIVFDVNGGLMEYDAWEKEVLMAIMDTIKRSDGEWFVTNSWEVKQ